MPTRTTELLKDSLASQNCTQKEADLFIRIIQCIKSYSVDENFDNNVTADVQNMIADFVSEVQE